jgi:hypothetical protein
MAKIAPHLGNLGNVGLSKRAYRSLRCLANSRRRPRAVASIAGGVDAVVSAGRGIYPVSPAPGRLRPALRIISAAASFCEGGLAAVKKSQKVRIWIVGPDE